MNTYLKPPLTPPYQGENQMLPPDKGGKGGWQLEKIFLRSILSLSFIFFITACTTTKTETGPAINSAQNAANYNVQLGMGYLNQGDVQRAKRKLLTALKQAPNWTPAQDAMAYFYENTGNTRLAEKYYLYAIQLEPNSGATHNNYGAFLCKTKRYQQADEQFMLAVQDTTYTNTAGAYENAASCALQIPDETKAIAYLKIVIQQDPQRPFPYLKLAQLSYKQENYPVAQHYFDSYAALINNNMEPEGLWLGIRLARKLGDTATAGRYTLMLQNKFPTSAEYKELIAATKTKS